MTSFPLMENFTQVDKYNNKMMGLYVLLHSFIKIIMSWADLFLSYSDPIL